MNIMGRTIIFAALAALFAGCEDRETQAVADFSNENLVYVGKNASVSPDGKSCAIDTTNIPLESYMRVVEFKNGALKPDTRYVLKMSVKISDAEDGAHLHTLVRNTAAYRDGTDILKHNTYAYDKQPQTTLKFKTPKNASEYALVFTAYKKLKAEISNIVIAEDASLGFIPINGNVRHYKLDKSKLPTGSADFEVMRPYNPEGEVVNAERFGIVPNKEISPKLFNKAMDYCRKNKAAKLLLQKNAVYKLVGDGSIAVADMENFTFDGNGSTLVFLKKNAPNFWVRGNKRVEIRNVKVDWDWETDPLASVVRVEAINQKEDFVDFKFVDYDKFPAYPNYVRAATLSGWDEKEKSVGLEGVMPFGYDMFAGRNPRPKFKWLNPNTIRFYGKSRQNSLKVGRLFRMQHYYYDMNNMVMWNNKHITISDFTVFSNPGHAFVQHGKQQYTLMERVKIVLPENSGKRAITCTADHYHIASSLGYIKVLDCEFSRGADDCINFHDNSSFGVKKSENSLVARKSYGTVGDTVEFRNSDYSPLGFEAKITGHKKTESGKCEILFDKPLPDSKFGKYVLFNKAFDTRNIVVKNSYFHHNRARGILVLARDVTIENCKFKRNEMGSIKIETGFTENIWCEGFGVDNVLVKNNTFESCNQMGRTRWSYEYDVFIGTYLKSDPSDAQTPYPILKNILFEGNLFKDNYGMAALIGSAQNVVFADNVFANETPRKNPQIYRNGFFIVSSSDVKILDNKFTKSEMTPRLGVWYDKSDTKNIVVSGNKVR